MRAVVLQRPGELSIADVLEPEPSADQVLLKVTHTGICRRSRLADASSR